MPRAGRRRPDGRTGLRCVGLLEALEQDLQRPVMSANQASLWHCLRLSGVNTPVNGYGRYASDLAGV